MSHNVDVARSLLLYQPVPGLSKLRMRVLILGNYTGQETRLTQPPSNKVFPLYDYQWYRGSVPPILVFSGLDVIFNLQSIRLVIQQQSSPRRPPEKCSKTYLDLLKMISNLTTRTQFLAAIMGN